MKPGTDVQLTVWRGGREQNIALRTDQLEEPQLRNAGKAGAPAEADEATSRLGLVVRPLTAQEKQQVNTQGTLVVQRVDGPAAAAGVQPGDILLGVNGKRVKSSAELQEAVKSASKTVALLIQREDAQIFFPLRLN